MMRVLASSPSWRDISPLAGAAFREATRMASTDPQAARADFVANREHLIGWIDRYGIGYRSCASRSPAATLPTWNAALAKTSAPR